MGTASQHECNLDNQTTLFRMIREHTHKHMFYFVVQIISEQSLFDSRVVLTVEFLLCCILDILLNEKPNTA